MREIDVNELEAVLATGAPLVDVREADEYAEARVPGAASIPLSEFVARVDEVPADGTVYVICAAGGRSARPRSTSRPAVSTPSTSSAAPWRGCSPAAPSSPAASSTRTRSKPSGSRPGSL